MIGALPVAVPAPDMAAPRHHRAGVVAVNAFRYLEVK